MSTIVAAICLLAQPGPEDADRIDFFEKKIRPVLVRRCYKCHSSASTGVKGGLLLDSRNRIRQGGDTGPAVVPGDVGASLIVEAIKYASLEMPPDKKLPDEVVRDFVRWIELGAPDPRDRPPKPGTVATMRWETIFEERRRWWSFQPVVDPRIPDVKGAGWSDQPIDRFVLSRLEENGLAPAEEADRVTLMRRLSFALTGLPPRPSEVDAFRADASPSAWERLVDRMLRSAHFGERWARHWMDVVRYTDTYGYEWDIPAKGAWRYRDYLIRAFNRDVPFDQLLREQIAGDLLERPRVHPTEHINESRIGTLFYQLGEKRHGDSAEFEGVHQEMLDNKIDAFSSAFQALTVSCARCHHHKFDPITQSEYYALAGVFMSSRWVSNTVDLPERNAAVLARLKSLKTQLRPILGALWQADARRFLPEMLEVTEALKLTEAPAAQENAAPVTASGATARSRWKDLLAVRFENEPALEDPLHAWIKVASAVRNGGSVAETWRRVASTYTEEARKRTTDNAAHFDMAIDFRDGIPDGWFVGGVGLRETVDCGDFTVALDGDAVVGRLLPGGLFTDALSPRLNGVVRTPILTGFKKGAISFEHSGGDFAAYRTVVDNAFLTERQRYLAREDQGWTRLSTLPEEKGRHVYIEFATKSSNPNFPPRVGLGGECSDEQIADPRSWFGLTRVALHEAPFTPKDELARFSRLFEGAAPATLEEAAGRYSRWFQTALQAWATDRSTQDDVRLINWMTRGGVLTNRRDAALEPRITALVDRYRRVEKELAAPWTVNGMVDIDPGHDYRLNIRGEYRELGDPVPRGYLRALTGSRDGVRVHGSGRRELAEFVADPENPLTARVFVNRIWHWLFGTGLVSTPNNFGRLGDRPAHHELLDYLATRFMEEGWSVKSLVRKLVLTKTWRQSNRTTEGARTVDPDNRLLHHYPLRRLEAEAIRDAMLATSGRLDARLYGAPVNPYRRNEDPQKRLFAGPLDGNGRRSIYTRITIMEPPRFLATFNQPEPKIPTGKRDVTSTVAQSLALLNNPFVSGQAERWSRSLIAGGGADRVERVTLMFRAAFAREPTASEVKWWCAAIADFAMAREVAEEALMDSVAVWKDVAHAVYNTKQFIYTE